MRFVKHIPRVAPCRGALCIVVVLLMLLPARVCRAQGGLTKPISTRSYSGQFTIQGQPQNSPLSESLRASIATNWVRLDPPLTAVSCERIKQALQTRLESGDRWRGRIFIRLWPIRRITDGPVVTQTRFSDGWMYRLDIPDAIDSEKFVRTIVTILLAERAQRHQVAQPAGVPAWLSEGLAQELLADRALELVIRPPDTAVNRVNIREISRSDRRTSTLSTAHSFFSDTKTPITLEELSSPSPEALTEEAAPRFRYSAQLFVHELLLLKDGRLCVGAMLDHFGQFPNWQAAFLAAFQAHFASFAEASKWWEMRCLEFQERGVLPTLGVAAALNRLAEALPIAIQHQTVPDAGSPRDSVSLQTFIQQADESLQLQLLPQKIQQLSFLPPRVTPEVGQLAAGYVNALEDYFKELSANAKAPPTKRMNQFMFSRMLRKAIRELNALDASRAQLSQSQTANRAISAARSNK